MAAPVSVANCKECVHWTPGGTKLVILHKKFDGHHVLEHLLTGERVELPTGFDWELSFDHGWAYVGGAGAPTTWCTKLFTRSCWPTKDSPDLFVAERYQVEGVQRIRTFWLSELRAQRSPHYVHWRFDDLDRHMSSLLVLTVFPARDHAHLFWLLRDVQQAAKFSTQFCASSKWLQKSTSRWMSGYVAAGFSCEHMLRPYSNFENAKDDGEAFSWSASTCFFLYILARCASEMTSTDDRRALMHLFIGFARTVLPDCEFFLRPGEAAQMGHLFERGVSISVRRNCIYFDALIGSVLSDELFGKDVSLFLVHVYRLRSSHPWALAQVISQLSCIIEDCFDGADWSTSSMSSAVRASVIDDGVRKKRRRIDPSLKRDLASLDGTKAKNGYRVSFVAQSLGLAIPKHDSKTDKRLNSTYLWAIRRQCELQSDYSLQLDARRIAGKDYLVVLLRQETSNVTMWLPPTARRSDAENEAKKSTPDFRGFFCFSEVFCCFQKCLASFQKFWADSRSFVVCSSEVVARFQKFFRQKFLPKTSKGLVV